MQKLCKILFAIAMVCTLTVAALVLVVPDHSGELRTDLVVGDYYTLRVNETIVRTYTITDITADGYIVTIESTGSSTSAGMSKEDFLKLVYFSPTNDTVDTGIRALIETDYGQHMCTLRTVDLSGYWVDSKNVIYKSFVGGVSQQLISTSLYRT
jgi:hypothetical protein